VKIEKLIDRLQRDCVSIAEMPVALGEKHRALDAVFGPFQRKLARSVAKALPAPPAEPKRRSPAKLTKRDFYDGLETGAQLARRADETREQAFARYSTEDAQGRALYDAYKLAPGDEPASARPAPERPMPPLTSAYRELMRKAVSLAEREGITEAQAFAKVYADPANRDLARAAG
jgi:hypothetical protein